MKKNQVAQNALRLLAARCPRLTGMCYWAGTSSIAIEELGHRESFDLDFHTHQALVDVRPILAELESELGESFSIVQPQVRDRLLSWLKALARQEEGADE